MASLNDGGEVKVEPSSKRIIKKLDYEDRKNSASDLVSRLKTRKVLGVGEIRGDEGDIYRSKISQILGPSEHLYVKMPKVLFIWQTANMALFFGSGITYLIFPKIAAKMEFVVVDSLNSLYFLRLYGSTLIGYVWLYRTLMSTRERSNIGTCLKSAAVISGLQVFANIFHICVNFQSTSYKTSGLLLFIVRLLVTGGSVALLQLFDPSSALCRWFRRLHLNDMNDSAGDRSPSPRHGSRENVLDVQALEKEN